jgi:hypothetical protein
MVTSNAGYGSNRQDRFTRSGAIRALRSVRLSRCRRFRPSPEKGVSAARQCRAALTPFFWTPFFLAGFAFVPR